MYVALSQLYLWDLEKQRGLEAGEVLKSSYDGGQAIKVGPFCMVKTDPSVTMGLSNYYYIFSTILTRK